jgi:membrane-bound serine protease (ClpP class)
MPEAILIIVLLLLAALALIFMEILTPSLGILTLAALGASVAAVWAAATMISSTAAVVLVILLLIGLPAWGFGLLKILPKTKLGGMFFLRPRGDAEDSRSSGLPGWRDYQQYVGKEAQTTSMLRPSGTIRIDGRRVDAVTEGGLIPPGTKVKVLRGEDMALVVRPLEGDPLREADSEPE